MAGHGVVSGDVPQQQRLRRWRYKSGVYRIARVPGKPRRLMGRVARWGDEKPLVASHEKKCACLKRQKIEISIRGIEGSVDAASRQERLDC